MKYVFMAIATFICWVWGFGFCDDAAAVAVSAAPVADPVDKAAIFVGYIWAAATALCATATGIAAAIRAFSPDSKIAHAIDAVGHWSGIIGTTIRPQPIIPPKP